MRVCFETFGCRLNKAEALQMEAEYLAKGWELTERHSDADLFIVRGCSVTARAQADSEKLIAHLRQRYPEVPIRICGCLKSGEATSSSLQQTRKVMPIRSDEDAASPLPVRTARAYLKVQDGCSGKCTFCIVPTFRGKSVSVPFDELLDKAKRFIDAGYHEIVVTGCNLSLYASEGKRLPDLIATLAELSANCRFRLGSLEPGACALATVDAMAEHENVCRFLHVPVQSGSNAILTAMKRPYRVKDVEELVSRTLSKMPLVGLGCDLMTGFPGETDANFTDTENLLARLPFNNAHVFPYSERPGTPAATFGDALPKTVRERRAHILSETVRRRRTEFAQSFIGKTVEIVVESADAASGWTGEYLRCEAEGSVPRKSLVSIRVTGVCDDRLYGTALTTDPPPSFST